MAKHNKYDRIIKENFQELTVWLLKRELGAKSIEIVPLLPKMQRTLEREADMLLLLLCSDEEGNFIANVEWQSKNEPVILQRLLLYYALAYYKYKLPVKNYVVYIGRNKVDMPREINHPYLNFSYELIDLTDLPPEGFLSSNVPEEVVMAILAGRKSRDERRSIIRKVLRKLQVLLRRNPSELDRKIVQLEVLGGLRNIHQLIIEEEQKMAITYNIENDIRYQQGVEKGIIKGVERGIIEGMEKERSETQTTFVKSLLEKTNHSTEEIADITGTSISFVEEIKRKLSS